MRFFQAVAATAALVAHAVTAAPAALAERAVNQDQFSFASSGVNLVGYHFYQAGDTSQGKPVVILAHGLGGLQTSRIMPFAERFAANGYHAITFDYRGWGQSAGSPRNIIDVNMQLDDYRAAMKAVATLPGVDASRVVLWGTSLSGGHVLTLGGKAAEPLSDLAALKAVIAQCPHVNGLATVGQLPPASLPPLVGAALEDLGRAAAGQPPVYVPLANRTGELGALTQAGAYEGYQFVQPTAPAPGNVMAARFALQLPTYSPDSLLSVPVPVFVGVGKSDNVTPPGPARSLASRIGADTHEYDGGHFAVYYGAPQFENIVADQVAFLKKAVPL